MTLNLQEKPNILLDLDETCISSIDSTTEWASLPEDVKRRMGDFTVHDMEGYYFIFERPGLQEFLDFLFKNFTVSVWTAGSKDYALHIINAIIAPVESGRKLDWIFFSYHCDMSKKIRGDIKALDILWDDYQLPGYNKQNTFIIDDNDAVFSANPENCVHISAFEFTNHGSESDRVLYDLMDPLNRLKERFTRRAPMSVTMINSHAGR